MYVYCSEDGDNTVRVYALDDNGDDAVDVLEFAWGAEGDDYATRSDARRAAEAAAQTYARQLSCDWGSNY